MKEYELNNDSKDDLPSEDAINKSKDFKKLVHNYEHAVRRPKPLYKDKRAFLILLFIVLIAWVISEIVDKKDKSNDPEKTNIEQVELDD